MFPDLIDLTCEKQDITGQTPSNRTAWRSGCQGLYLCGDCRYWRKTEPLCIFKTHIWY